MQRKDDPAGVNKFQDTYLGGKALLVLGGTSAKDWESIRDQTKPDVILGANGTCFEIPDLDFHLVVENMHMMAGQAALGVERAERMMEIISPKNTAKVKMISYLNWERTIIVDSRVKAIKIKRMGELGDDYEKQMKSFSFREYGEGFLAGPLFMYPGALSSQRIKFRVGTVATQLIHLAGILGVSEVHTIGMDFCFKNPKKHHNYDYPNYEPDRFRTPKMFTAYKGIATMHDWIQGAEWLKSIKPLFDRDGLNWIDHSGGLLKVKGLWCANG